VIEVALRRSADVEDGLAGFAGGGATASGIDWGDGLVVADDLCLWGVLVGLGLVLHEVAIVGRRVGRGRYAVELALLGGRVVA